MVGISALGILACFILLIAGSWKKVSMFLIAVVGAGIVGVTGGLGFIEAINGPYMDGFVGFVKGWAVILALGALLGNLYSESGAAWRIGDTLIRKGGQKFVLPVYVLVGAVLVYCGVAVPVTVFILVPLARVIFPKAGIPWFLFPGITGLAIATFGMYAPGSLQMVNLIPVRAMNVSTMAAPVEGVVACIFLLVVGLAYILWEIKRNAHTAKDEHPDLYLQGGSSLDDAEQDLKAPSFLISVLPVLITLALVNIVKMEVTLSFMIGCIIALVMFWKNIPDKAGCVSKGFNDGILPCILVSAVVGLGSVISATPVFEVIRDGVMQLPINGLAKVAAVTTVISGICASGAGGVQLTMDLFGPEFLSWGYSPEIIARVAAIACGGLDSMPWNGSVVMLFAASGVGYNKGYKAVAILMAFLPSVASLIAAATHVLIA